jgi:predicted GIY-YIG superfamily endonuclease
MEVISDNEFKEFLISIGGKTSNCSEVIKSYFKCGIEDKTLYDRCVQFLVNNPSYYKLAKPLIAKVRPKPNVVYLLKHENEIVYVGKTSDIAKRLEAHYRDKEWDEVSVYELVDTKSQSVLENTLISKYRPKYNKILNIQEDLSEYHIHTDPVNFIDWVTTQECISYISDTVQERLGVLFSFKGYVLTVQNNEGSGFYLKESPNSFVEYNEYFKSERADKPFCERLQELIDKFKHSAGYEEISKGIHRIGDIVITSKGRWRSVYNQRWYYNADLIKIENQLSLRYVTTKKQPIDNRPMWFGKYKGKTVAQIREIDPQYINWMECSLKPQELKLLGL